MNFIAQNKFIFVPKLWLLSFYAEMHLWWISYDFISAIIIYA
jgi:hypothetical protein